MGTKGNKILKVAAGSLFCLSAMSCMQSKNEVKGGKKLNSLRAEGYVIVPQTFSNTYTASGSLLPNEQIEIHPEVSGRVTNIFFKEGSAVKKGQVLVQLY